MRGTLTGAVLAMLDEVKVAANREVVIHAGEPEPRDDHRTRVGVIGDVVAKVDVRRLVSGVEAEQEAAPHRRILVFGPARTFELEARHAATKRARPFEQIHGATPRTRRVHPQRLHRQAERTFERQRAVREAIGIDHDPGRDERIARCMLGRRGGGYEEHRDRAAHVGNVAVVHRVRAGSERHGQNICVTGVRMNGTVNATLDLANIVCALDHSRRVCARG